MRVDENTLTDQVSSTASRAAESQRVQVDTSASSSSSGTSAGDRVDLSSLGGRIAQALQGLSSQSAQRVSQLQKDFQAGRYQPDAQQISHAMVAQLSGTAGS
jgi:anti-sigma28 factor (negative regulator of flagellin synthesis)